MLSVEIIASGSELTSGDRLNTNAQWLSLKLIDLGFQPRWHTTLGDIMEDNVAALEIAWKRADCVIMTGGLGPTQDDLTRDVFAAVGGIALEFREELMEHISRVFAIRGVAMPERNRLQAFMPKNSTALTNPLGTAPGIWMMHQSKPLVALPGVPREMYRMWSDQVVPLLIQRFGRQNQILKRKINLVGLGESAIEAKILDLTHRDHIPEVGITASEGVVSLRLVARSDNESENQEQLLRCGKIIYERLSEYIFSEGDVHLAAAVIERCRNQGRNIVVSEIGTEGLLVQQLFANARHAMGITIEGSTFGSWQEYLATIGLTPEEHTVDSALQINAATKLANTQGRSIGIFVAYQQGSGLLPHAPADKSHGPTVEYFQATYRVVIDNNIEIEHYRAAGSRREILTRSVNFALATVLKSLQKHSEA